MFVVFFLPFFPSLSPCLFFCNTFYLPPVFGWLQWSPNTLRFRFTISSRYAGTRRYSSVRYHRLSPTTWTWWAGSIRTAAVTWPMDNHTVSISMEHERGMRRESYWNILLCFALRQIDDARGIPRFAPSHPRGRTFLNSCLTQVASASSNWQRFLRRTDVRTVRDS